MKRFFSVSILLVFYFSTFAQTGLNTILEITAPASLVGSLKFAPNASTWSYQLKVGDNFTGNIALGINSKITDSLAQLQPCDTITTNVKGKIALVRRSAACTIAAKALVAQNAGAIGIIVYQEIGEAQTSDITGGTIGLSVKIPAFNISYNDAQKIINALNLGRTVTVNYRYKSLFNTVLAQNYASPIKENITFSPIVLSPKVIKLNANDTVTILAKVKIIEPDGNAVTSNFTNGTFISNPIQGDTSTRIYNFPSFTPTKLGKHYVFFSNNKNTEIATDSFVITNYTFAQDLLTPADNYALVDSNLFKASGYIFDVGHFFYTGVNADKATHASFAINNPQSFAKGDYFTLQLYPISRPQLQNFNDGLLFYSNLTSVAKEQYFMTGRELKPDSLLTVEFKTPVSLTDNSTYLLVVQYNGTLAGGSAPKCPAYSSSGIKNQPYYFNDFVYAYSGNAMNQIYMGFTSNAQSIVRLQMAGFNPTGFINTTEAWSENQVTVFPNPVNTQLTLNFDLQNLNPIVDVLIVSSEGLEIKSMQLKNVQHGTQTLDVSELANGLYFARLIGSDGWRTKTFVVAK